MNQLIKDQLLTQFDEVLGRWISIEESTIEEKCVSIDVEKEVLRKESEELRKRFIELLNQKD